jgi:alginate O-acetyltransferase complex protein AlgI
MVFGTPLFFFLLLPIILLLYFFIIPRFQLHFLLFCSFFLYLWSEGRNTWILLLTIIVTFFCSRLLSKLAGTKQRVWVLAFGISVNLLPLLIFKYAGFFISNLNPLLTRLSIGTLLAPHLPLPLGISFSTFLAISLLIDVYRQTAAPAPTFVASALYVSFFPTILAGPITPFRELAPQLRNADSRNQRIHSGVQRFIIGLGKKVLLADILARVVNPVFSIPAEELTLPLSWLGLVAYTLQIYFDFSGYTDMAVGLGQILGFRFMENFNYPYAATSVMDFWTRWHQSLTRWLRDYLFLPLAYQVLKRIPQEKWLGIKAESWSYGSGMFFTMVLCGLWHGASWTFILWGGYYGILILLERFVWGKRLKKRPVIVRRLYTLGFVTFGWLLFRSANLEQALSFLKAMCGFNGLHSLTYYPALYFSNDNLIAFLVALIGVFPLASMIKRKLAYLKDRGGKHWQWMISTAVSLLQLLLLTAVLAFAFLYIANETYQPFIYFRF